MPTFFDLSPQELRSYRPERSEPRDFDAFWETTLAESRSRRQKPSFVPIDCGLRTVEAWDATFSGYGGHAIKGWLLMPVHRKGRLPCVVEFLGYGDGRSFPVDRLLYSALGFAHFVMDNRGQGSGYRPGDTPDLGADESPHYPGFMTRGILDPARYFYRRIITDAVLALDAVTDREDVDPGRLAVAGMSQGGGLALAVAGLDSRPSGLISDVPFLCHYRRATEIADEQPYNEIARYCRVHRDRIDQVFATLAYFDGLNFAARAKSKALFSVGLMDEICPPSTVYAAFNHYGGPKRIQAWPYNGHDGGGPHQDAERIRFLHEIWGSGRRQRD
jgi:cephalosporin-C deacetylase